MTPSTPRTIRGPLIRAVPSPPIFTKARGHSPAARAGLAFQRKVGRALRACANDIDAILESEPWFTFRDANGDGCCAPDFILTLPDSDAIVIEVKLKYVLGAEVKLKQLYLPVVAKARNLPVACVKPLVITKILTPDCLNLGVECVGDAALSSPSLRAPVLQWLGQGRILWEAAQPHQRRGA